MRRKGLLILALLWVTVATVLLAGCSLRIGFVGSDSIGRTNAKFDTYVGTKQQSISLEQGQSLQLEYDVKVSKGSLHISVNQPDGTLMWEELFTEGGKATLNLPATQSGAHRITIKADKAGGSFDVKWRKD